MIDSAISITLGILLIEMARLGGQVSANPPVTRAVARRYTWRFRLYSIVAGVLVFAQGVRIYQTSREAKATQHKLSESITSLGTRLQIADTGRQVDNAYLKAKLEDAYKFSDQLRQFAPALLKMAETGA